MRGLLGSIVLATFLAPCSGNYQQGLNGKQDWHECDGLNDLNLQIPPTAAGISITKCNISKIKTDAFSNFSNSLVQLNISGCGVEEIEPDAFTGLDKLQVIRDVDASWTRGLSRLKKLDLWGNGNVSIDSWVEDLMPKIAGNVRINRKLCLSQKILGPWAKLCYKTMLLHMVRYYIGHIKYSERELNEPFANRRPMLPN